MIIFELLLDGGHSSWGPAATSLLFDPLHEPTVQLFAERLVSNLKLRVRKSRMDNRLNNGAVFNNILTSSGLLSG